MGWGGEVFVWCEGMRSVRWMCEGVEGGVV